MSDEVIQLWVRTDKAKVFGPLSPGSIELLLDAGVIAGRVQVSLNGNDYVYPGRMPGIRQVFPKALWGDDPLPHTELDDTWSAIPPPPPPLDALPAPRSTQAPAAVPRAGPGAPIAGPGARAQQQTRPLNPALASAKHRAPAPPGNSPRSPETLFDDDASPAKTSASSVRLTPAPARPPATAAMNTSPNRASPVLEATEAAPKADTSAVVPLDAMPPSGTLLERNGQRLYFLAAALGLSGRLSLTLADRTISFHFRKGSPDLVESTHPDDALTTFLLRKQLVIPEHLARAQQEGARFGGELLPALFGLGLLNPNVALEALSVRTKRLLALGLLASEGTFSFEPIELPAHRAMPAGHRWQLYTEQLRQIPLADAIARLGGAMDLPIMKSSGSVPAVEFRLTPQETRAYAGFDGTKSLTKWMAARTTDAEHAVRVAFMLTPCDLVSFAGVVRKPAPVQVAQIASPPPQPAGTDTPSSAVPRASPFDTSTTRSGASARPGSGQSDSGASSGKSGAGARSASAAPGASFIDALFDLPEDGPDDERGAPAGGASQREEGPSAFPIRPRNSDAPGVVRPTLRPDAPQPIAPVPAPVVDAGGKPSSSGAVVPPAAPAPPEAGSVLTTGGSTGAIGPGGAPRPSSPTAGAVSRSLDSMGTTETGGGPRPPAPGPASHGNAPRPPGAPGSATHGGIPRPPGAPGSVTQASVPRPPGAPGSAAPASLAPPVGPVGPATAPTVPRPDGAPGSMRPLGAGQPPAGAPQRPGGPVASSGSGLRSASASGVNASRGSAAQLFPFGSSPSGVRSAGASSPGLLSPFATYDSQIRVLVELVAKHRSLTHFEVLSIPTDASPAAIKSAYFKLAKDFHPDTVPPEAPEVLAKAKADVFARIGEAHRVLTDPNLRAEYLLELQSGGPDKVDVSMILQAEELFQKGKLLIQARKYPEAIKMFDEVITITPDDAEVYSWRGYAKFFTFQDRKQGLVEAMKDVTHCLKRNANVVAAFYHQGMMNKICGDIAAAKKHFQQAVRMDSKHLEAQRELRALK